MKKTMILIITTAILLQGLISCATTSASVQPAEQKAYTVSIDDSELSEMTASSFTPITADSTGTFTIETSEKGLKMGGVPKFGNYASFGKPVAADGFALEFTCDEKSGFADKDGSWTSFALMDAPLYIGQEGVNGMVLLMQPVKPEGQEYVHFNVLQQPGLTPVGSITVDRPAEGTTYTVRLMKSDAGWILTVNDIPASLGFDLFPADMFRNNRVFFMTGITSNINKESYITLHRLDKYKFYGAAASE